MMDYRAHMKTAGAAASTEQIHELASMLSIANLPPTYREFLSQCNGATPKHNLIAIRAADRLESAVLDQFLGAGPGEHSALHATSTLWTAFRLPRTAAIIADDHNGNHLAISFEPDTFGAIYFWDHERGTTDHAIDDTIGDFEQLTLLAPTFEALVNKHLLDQAALDAIYEAEPPRTVRTPATPKPAHEPGAHRVTHFPAPEADDGSVVYRLGSDSGARQVRINRDLLAPTGTNDGIALASDWQPLTAVNPEHDPPLDLPFKDTHLLLLNEAAHLALKPALAPYGEFLELDNDTGPLTMFRCLNVVDALVPGTGLESDPKRLDGWLFDPDKTASAGIFTVPQQTERPWIFYPPSFLRLLATSGLEHTYFELVWDVAGGARALKF